MHRRSVRLFAHTALVCGLAAPALPAQSALSNVFSQMDAASKRFQSATADVERDNFERVVRETTRQKGTMFIDRAKGGIEFGGTVADVDASGAAAGSPSRIVSYAGGVLQLYTPSTKQVDVFRSGANQGKLEGYFALGFGATSRDLQASWDVTDGGPDTVTDNGQAVKVEKLVLVSKDPAVRDTFSRITLWMDPARDVSLKQFFETPSGNTQTALYSNVKLNARPNKAAYKVPSGKGVTVVNH